MRRRTLANGERQTTQAQAFFLAFFDRLTFFFCLVMALFLVAALAFSFLSLFLAFLSLFLAFAQAWLPAPPPATFWRSTLRQPPRGTGQAD